MTAAEEVKFRSEGLEMHGLLREAAGSPKAAVLFCHGAFETQENWSAFADRLHTDGLSVLTFDFAGHGGSQGTRGLVDLRTWAYNIRDAMNCLQDRGYSSFGLVGWESGGSAAVLAAAHDARLACAVFLSTPVLLLPTLAERVVYLLASAFGRLKAIFVRRPLTISRHKQMKQLGVLSDEAANEDYFADPKVAELYEAFPIPEGLDNVWVDIVGAARNVRVPALVIHGAHDRVIPPAQSEKLYSLLQGPRQLRMMDGSGHAVHLDMQKDGAYSLISAWLRDYLSGT